MSISYDTMSAYYKRKNNELKNEDLTAQKQIADAALSQIESNRAQLNNHTQSAVKAAYIQKDRAEKGLQAETSKINNLATTERLVRGLNTQQGYNDVALDNAGLKVNAVRAQSDADTEAVYGKRFADTELAIRLAQDEQNRAYIKAQEDAKAQEGYLEKLSELSRQYNYDYDFDADIFALKQQGYTNDDWQIQYLQEAKRLQARTNAAIKAKKKSNKKSVGEDKPYDDSVLSQVEGNENAGNGTGADSWDQLMAQGVGAGLLLPQTSRAVSDQAVDSLGFTGREAAVLSNAINEYNSGASNIELLSERLRTFGLGIDENGNLRRL